MKYLAIDTSSKHLLIIVNKDGEIFSTYKEDCMADHSTKLMVETEELFKKANLTVFDLDFFAVVVGPGSFTGIRIGVATIKALSLATNKPVLPITSFDTITYNKGIGSFLSVIDAKHDNFYILGITDRKEDFSPKFANIKEVLKLIEEYNYKVISFENLQFLHEIVDIKTGLIKAIEEKQNLITFDMDMVKPFYLRKSQAEEGR